MRLGLSVCLGAVLGWATCGVAAPNPDLLQHFGMCDASAGLALGSHLFVVGNDEDNALRVYHSDASGPPVAARDLSTFLQVDPDHPEADFEGAARIGDRVYWITSHGRNKEGKKRHSRQRFFATRWSPGEAESTLTPVGRPYMDLLDDLLREPRLYRFQLSMAAQRAPKDPRGFNIEGLAATPEGQLLIGFRNPIPGDRALIVPLLNPAGLVEGQRAQFGDPILLDLGGQGVRDITRVKEEYFLIAGAYDGRGQSRLLRWRGPGHQPLPVPGALPKDFNAEAILFHPDDPSRLLILSDDGTRNVGGVDCKKLEDPTQRRFRSLWFSLEE